MKKRPSKEISTSKSGKGKRPFMDRKNIFDPSKEMEKIFDILNMEPEIRAKRVNEIKKLIEENRYQIDSNTLADKMIKEFLFELFYKKNGSPPY